MYNDFSACYGIGALSQDEKYYAFTSNWGNTLGSIWTAVKPRQLQAWVQFLLKRRDELLAKAGTLENIPADIPIPLGSLGTKYFLDGFHLNPKGAKVFTLAVARDLKTRFAPGQCVCARDGQRHADPALR